MDLAQIQTAIATLPRDQQMALLEWLAERDQRDWDAQIERDFSPGGAGLEILAASEAYARLRRLRGKVRFSRTLAEMKDDQ